MPLGEYMSAKAQQAFGRTWYELSLLNLLRTPNTSITTDPFPKGSEESKGFNMQGQTLYRQTIKRIFREGKQGGAVYVGRWAFRIVTRHGTVEIEGGMIESISLASFPGNTTVVVLSPTNQTYYNLGNPDIH